jgi:cyclophilin family peptidyl-prolyl cis-trans isomerase
MVRFSTSLGDIDIEMLPKEAPKSVENFLQYVDDGFFDGLIFHRIVPGFVIQGGGLTPDYQQKKNRAPIENEATNGLKNKRGTLSMARTNDINSATSQFFVNLKDNDFLDHKSKSPSQYGYAVFAKVTQGMDVVDKIAAVSTGRKKGYDDAPLEDVVIVSARRIDAA